jgi:hypothetical protein
LLANGPLAYLLGGHQSILRPNWPILTANVPLQGLIWD